MAVTLLILIREELDGHHDETAVEDHHDEEVAADPHEEEATQDDQRQPKQPKGKW